MTKRKQKTVAIFSGASSAPVWDAINKAKTVRELRAALYFVCCRLQELESLLEKRHLATEVSLAELGDGVREAGLHTRVYR